MAYSERSFPACNFRIILLSVLFLWLPETAHLSVGNWIRLHHLANSPAGKLQTSPKRQTKKSELNWLTAGNNSLWERVRKSWEESFVWFQGQGAGRCEKVLEIPSRLLAMWFRPTSAQSMNMDMDVATCCYVMYVVFHAYVLASKPKRYIPFTPSWDEFLISQSWLASVACGSGSTFKRRYRTCSEDQLEIGAEEGGGHQETVREEQNLGITRRLPLCRTTNSTGTIL